MTVTASNNENGIKWGNEQGKSMVAKIVFLTKEFSACVVNY